MVDPRGSLEFTAAAPHDEVKLLTYPGAFHEIFNDLDRDRVIGDTIAWLDALVGGA